MISGNVVSSSDVVVVRDFGWVGNVESFCNVVIGCRKDFTVVNYWWCFLTEGDDPLLRFSIIIG